MKSPSRRRVLRRASMYVRSLLLVTLPVAAMACGESGPTEEDVSDDDVTGLWTASISDQATGQTLTLYARITATTVEVWTGLEATCFDIDRLEITSRDGESFTLQDDGPEPATVSATLSLDGNQLRARGITAGNSTVIMDPSSADTSGFEECSLDGTWAGANNDDWVDIDGELFTVYQPFTEACRSVLHFVLETRGGDRYFLNDRYANGFLVVSVENKAGTLAVTFADGGVLTYGLTEDDPGLLPICGGGDEASVECSELPALTIGEAFEDGLEATDPRDADLGTYYDLYGLTLESRTEVRIDQTSDAIDPYVRLWSADGRFIASNDDASTQTLDSSIAITLDPACYRVEASSYGFEETGAYTLSVN